VRYLRSPRPFEFLRTFSSQSSWWPWLQKEEHRQRLRCSRKEAERWLEEGSGNLRKVLVHLGRGRE